MDLFEIALILIVALIVLGPERLPDVLHTFGKVMRELRLASNSVLRELNEAIEQPPRAPALLERQPPAPASPPPEPEPQPPAPRD